MQSAKPLIDTPAQTLREAHNKTHRNPLRHVKIEGISDTLVEVEAIKEVNTWANKIARVEIRTVDDTLR